MTKRSSHKRLTPTKTATKRTVTASGRGKTSRTNPILVRWAGPFGLPPFHRIEAQHFGPAFEAGLARHREEIAQIARQASRPTFANTIAALERSGRMLGKVSAVFFNLAGADTNEKLQCVERKIAPQIASHYTRILLNAKLFGRVEYLYRRRDSLQLTDEQRRVLELQHMWFVRAGAKLGRSAKARVAQINERLASLSTQFAQNVLKDEQSWRLVLEDEKDLEGLPPSVRAAAARAAADEGLEGKHVVTLSRSSVEPFLQFSARRDLREEAFNAWVRRGEMGGKSDNSAIVAEVIALRTELAKLLGFETYADYSLDDTMAKSPGAVRDLLDAVWPAAIATAAKERDTLAQRARAEGGNYEIAAWDWRYLTEKERKARFDLDEAATRPYFQLDNVIAAAFDTAGRLFGLRFKERPDIRAYHEDVRVWEVTDKRGAHVGVFLGDYFSRPSKRSGAWMSRFRSQSKIPKVTRPIIINVMNFARGGENEATLLSLDDARTLFHEFGHGLHGLLSDVTYPSISGTSVARDFVELPSQLYEHWLMQPEVLQKFAVHYKTGKPMPQELLKKIKKARNFNQGFTTVEFTASAYVDIELHSLSDTRGLDVNTFERATLKRLGMPREIVMRHRIPHFLHIMGGYAAGYYSYLWSEVMDADAFTAFEKSGNVFDAATAAKLKKFIYSGGNSRDPLSAYISFRGRAPDVSGLLKKRGFAN